MKEKREREKDKTEVREGGREEGKREGAVFTILTGKTGRLGKKIECVIPIGKIRTRSFDVGDPLFPLFSRRFFR